MPGLSPLLAELLVARGYDSRSKVDQYFHPTPEHLHDPFLLKGMREAVGILSESLSKGEKILVQGDYDCDGICGTTLMLEALQEIGAEVGYHLPDRFTEGYGLSATAVERCRDEGYQLLITVDCGSSSHAEIEIAREWGIKVIVTDHHAVPTEPPNPDAFINPQQPDCPYPFKGICGTGVAFKLIQALRGQSGKEPEYLLDLVALATVADVVPLKDENRALVQFGLQEMGRSPRVGLTALLEVAGRSGRDVVDSFTVGFTLGPRLNAAGRLEHARLGVELLTCRSLGEARQLAQHLDSLNEARKECERAIQEEIEERLSSDPTRYRRGAIVEWGEGWHQGVIGITAGRLAEKYGVPTLVIATDGEHAKGSGRSPENVDLYQALKKCGDLFSKYGGHPRAGGFSLSSSNLEKLREAMIAAAEELRDGPAPVWVDSCLSMGDADLDLVRELERMEPFGEANPKPIFLVEGAEIVNQRLVGSSGDHLQLELEQAGQRRRAIAFRQADLLSELRTQELRYDLRCQIGRDEYRNVERLKVQVLGVVRPPCQNAELESSSVVDLRHLRGRRSAISQWLESAGSCAVCRRPDKAEELYPQFKGQFFTYQSVPADFESLVLLAPPSNLGEWNELLRRCGPRQVVVLFGNKEVEQQLGYLLSCRWNRPLAIEVWKRLRRTPQSELRWERAVRQAADELKIATGMVEQILNAFEETGALVRDGEKLSFGTASGMKLEDTSAFRNQSEGVEGLRAVREYFSGPDLAERLKVELVKCAELVSAPEGF